MNYIFDVDGTLTPSRGTMDREFATWFEHFASHNSVYLVTGSDREKTLEQIPPYIYNLCMKVYQCSGNHVFEQDRELYKNDWELPDEHWRWLLNELHNSSFAPKTGTHFDQRVGLLNFSVLGRKATTEQRAAYKVWDEEKQERHDIATRFNERWYDYEWWDISADLVVATVAGDTGIDITPHRKGKEQIVSDFDPKSIIFYGDKTMKGGNDYTIAEKVTREGGKVIQVESWKDTFSSLQDKENVL